MVCDLELKFFLHANNILQKYLIPVYTQLNICYLQVQWRNFLFGNEDLLEEWLN